MEYNLDLFYTEEVSGNRSQLVVPGGFILKGVVRSTDDSVLTRNGKQYLEICVGATTQEELKQRLGHVLRIHLPPDYLSDIEEVLEELCFPDM